MKLEVCILKLAAAVCTESFKKNYTRVRDTASWLPLAAGERVHATYRKSLFEELCILYRYGITCCKSAFCETEPWPFMLSAAPL